MAKKQLKILLQISKVDQARLKYANPSIHIEPEFYKLPKDLENMTPKQQLSIFDQVKKDLFITDMAFEDYEVFYRNMTIFVIPKDLKIGGR